MTMGEKIKKLRIRRKRTQKELGDTIGLSDVRIRQYELNIRTPKEEQLKKIAYALGFDIHTLYDHKIDSYIDVMYILFELEDDYGLSLNEIDGNITFSFSNANITNYLYFWYKQKSLYENGDITKEEYEYYRRI